MPPNRPLPAMGEILTQRVPNTEVLDTDAKKQSLKKKVFRDSLLINCRLPKGTVVENCNTTQRLQYIQTADVDGEIIVLQDVRFLVLGNGVFGEIADQTVQLARESLPSGAVELTPAMFNQWRAGEEITLG